jgi:8-oxo-dGTP pyrophosphatase MutT (NUDIX family)
VDIKLVLQREPRTGKAWFPSGIVLPNEEHVDADVRELFEQTGTTISVDGLNFLGGRVVCMPLFDSKTKHFYVYVAYVHVPYVTTNHTG